MGVRYFFNRTVTVRRLRTVTGNQQAFQATATADGSIQPMNRERRTAAGIVSGQAWEAFFEEDVDIKEGDLITDDKGVSYKVTEKAIWDVGINRHLSVILIEYNA